MPVSASRRTSFLELLPSLLILSTAFVLMLGAAAAIAWSQTGDRIWIHWFFSYFGATFLVGCSVLGTWVAFRCWRYFSPGDLLRPAWLFITLSALFQFIGGLIGHILGDASSLNPLLLLGQRQSRSLIQSAAEYGQLFSPVYMLFLIFGLFFVLRVCRQHAVLGSLKAVDVLLLSIVLIYTIDFFATVVFAPVSGAPAAGVTRVLRWTSDPLLCILLFQAILIRRSAANMGWGLIARCWLSFTAAIFLTSVGDIGLWASAKGYLPHLLEIASWHVWFLASAAYALGPCYQLQAMFHATSNRVQEEIIHSVEPLQHAI